MCTMNWRERIVINLKALAGKFVIKDKRFAVKFIIDLLANEKLLNIQNFCFFSASDRPISAASQHAGVEEVLL